MSSLPPESQLPTQHLAGAFANVTNSYKFLWFLAILDEIDDNVTLRISIPKLLGRMVAIAWYPVNYFRLNFGTQDIVARLVNDLMTQGKAPLDARSAQVRTVATTEIQQDTPLGRSLAGLGNYVPYRFIRPFFAQATRGLVDAQVNRKMRDLAQIGYASPDAPCLYRFGADDDWSIELHPVWADYLRRHSAILRGYTLWHFLLYLQSRNPGVPNLAVKLFAPTSRNLAHARRFWDVVFAQVGPISCIYSGVQMDGTTYSLDHFLPWRFVAHDNLWNLIPTPKAVNSSKNDSVPDLATYFDRMVELQYHALQAVLSTGKHRRLLEDYLYLLDADTVIELRNLTLEQFRRALHAIIAPQAQIALNLGFPGGWRY
jgi:hypothetical protein